MDTKKLRQKILDLAIRGKLVPQDPNDEPASVLLERIKAEKERLIKEGKIKRSKKTAKTSDTPHYPYLLPKGWKWCKLEDIVSFGGGKTPSMDNKEYWYNGNHLWVTSKDMKCSHITNSLMKITDKALKVMTIYERGTLLVVTRSGILRHTLPISILETPATVNQDLKAISPYIQELSEYLYIVIKANEHYILKEYHKDGTTVDSIDFEKFKCLPIPLAPITEQRRIIAEIKHWFALIEQINQSKSDLQTLIKQTKSKILDLAIHGKLVPQDPNDEPASKLLKRINPDFTPCDNAHYTQLPKGWTICRLEQITDYEQPTDYIVESTDYDTSYSTPVLTAGKSFIIGYTNETTGIYSNLPCIIFDDFTTDSKLVNFPFKVKSSAMKILKVNQNIEIDYVAIFMSITRLTGNTHKRYWISEYSKLKIPIPPKTEQKRIVSAVQNIFAKLDMIMENL